MSSPPRAVPFSALVVTLDEERYLDACLASLAFCDDIIVIDLGSTDRSVDIARTHGARVIAHGRVPYVELVRPVGVAAARHDWLLIVDPDEVLPEGTGELLRACVAEHEREGLGQIALPMITCFRGKVLRHGSKGGIRYHPRFVIHRGRVEVSTVCQIPPRLRAGYHCLDLRELREPVRHFWVDSIRELVAKYGTQGLGEGERWHSQGRRFSWLGLAGKALKAVLIETRKAFFLDGTAGCVVAAHTFCFAIYGQLALRRYEKALARGSGPPA